MLGKLKRRIAAAALGSLLKSLARDKPTSTTISGIIAGAILAVPGLDLTALIEGEPSQVARVVAGVLVATLGYLAGKETAGGRKTLVGVIAGAAYSVQGSLEALTTGVVIALLGYFTGQPARPAPLQQAELAEAAKPVPPDDPAPR